VSRHPPDPDSLLYARYWEPVLAVAARGTVDRVLTTPADLLDIGTGTGSLVLAAAERWPEAQISGLDASAGMLSVARHRVAVGRSEADQRRFTWLAADAADIPLADASVDVVTSSFMLQIVEDRPAVMREVLRVLRPGGTFSLVTWIAEELTLAADEVFEQVVRMLKLDEPSPGFRLPRSGDFAAVGDARDELGAAGFDIVEVGADELRYVWTPADYLKFKQCYDDRELFEALGTDDRRRLAEAVEAGFAALPDDAFAIRAPLVSGLARKPLS
jgi:ubiquinone/menaquinone biosynthesis C-methylase UbiE